MFAFTCAKANGTHLGTCIDRFYFGSCCKIDEEPGIYPQDNSIDDGPPARPFVTTHGPIESNDIPAYFSRPKPINEKSTPATYSTEASTVNDVARTTIQSSNEVLDFFYTFSGDDNCVHYAKYKHLANNCQRKNKAGNEEANTHDCRNDHATGSIVNLPNRTELFEGRFNHKISTENHEQYCGGATETV